MRLVHGVATHVGLVRRQNEDSFVGSPGLYAVCDGMGGARAGEVASEVACRVLTDMPKNAGEPELRDAITKANALIRDRSLADPTLSGMGTTLTAASGGSGGLLTIAQVGDSRAYLLRGGELRQVTEDHSLVAEMIRRGQLTPEQAAVHPHRSIITRALGTEESVKPDIIELPLEAGDRLLLCSDGLSGMVPADEVERLLGGGEDPQGVADELVAAALHHGGEDNVTVVVIFAVGSADDELDDSPVLETEAPALEGPSTAGAEEPTPTGSSIAGAGEGGFGPLVGTPESGARSRVFGSRRRLVMAIAVLVVAAAVAAGAFLAFNSTVFFVGTTQGQVALFRGMPYKIMSVDLYRVEETVPVRFEQLDAYLQERVDAHELVTKEEGLRFIRGIETSQ